MGDMRPQGGSPVWLTLPLPAERPDFSDAIILRKGASVEHVVSGWDWSQQE